MDLERRKQIDRTKTGVLLLLVGTLTSWIPLIGVIGALLVLIGAILVILGRKAFGSTHARNVVVSIGLFFLGVIIVAAGGVILIAAFATSFVGGTPSQAAIQSALNTFLLVAAVGAIVEGLATVLFTLALQNQMGKYLLFGAYAASILIQIAIFVVISGTLAQILASSFPGGTYDPTAAAAALVSFQGQVATLGLLAAIPALLSAGAYYIAWNRINKGEIPPPSTPPGMAPPTMPMPPPM